MITLEATPRTIIGKSSAILAKDGQMPAIVYGPKKEAVSIAISLLEFKRILRNEGESSVVHISGLGTPFQVLIHEIDRDPVTGTPRHADFYAIQKGAKIEVAVPLSFIGEAPAVKEGASLVKVLHELEIEVAPEHLPHEIEVDLSVLASVGDQIHVKDLKLPAGVVLRTDEEEVVALVQEIVEEPEEPSAAPDMASIEVEKKGKAEGADEEAEA
jgi:large subunit ribosomal protein L25